MMQGYIKSLMIAIVASIAIQANAQSSADQARAYFFAAEKAYKAGNYKDALKSIKKAEKISGQTGPVLLKLEAQTLVRLGRLSDAKTKLNLFYASNPSEASQRDAAPILLEIDNKITQIQRVAERGNASDQYEFALDYDRGRGGLPRDRVEARKWFRKAAEKGHAEGQYKVGIMYSKGEGVPQSDTEAFKWFKRGAENGSGRAQSWLGHSYREGTGTPVNITEAIKWYRKSALEVSHGNAFWLGRIYDEGEGVPEDNAEALKWYLKASYRSVAQYRIGLMYMNGDGVPTDKVEAIKWFRKAAEQGHLEAKHYLTALSR